MLPNSQRINRGNYEMKQLVQACRANEVTDLILLTEHRGNPGIKATVYPRKTFLLAVNVYKFIIVFLCVERL